MTPTPEEVAIKIILDVTEKKFIPHKVEMFEASIAEALRTARQEGFNEGVNRSEKVADKLANEVFKRPVSIREIATEIRKLKTEG